MTEKRVTQLLDACKEMRLDILHMCHRCGKNSAHLSGSLSAVEILGTLFLEVLNLPKDSEENDKFILSKAHAGIALYAAMKQAGIVSQYEIESPLRGDNTDLFRHPKRNPNRYIEMTGGSLGQGLSYGAGLACAIKRRAQTKRKVYVVLGDGECNEGSVWEAASFISHMKLDNLVVIVDKNGLQLDGFTSDIMEMDNLEERWSAFGFNTFSVDGHDPHALYNALAQPSTNSKPLAIIANTLKGKGVSFAENAQEWHDKILDNDSYKTALQEVSNG